MQETELYYDQMDTPLGPMSLFAEVGAIIRIEFGAIEQVNSKINSWLTRYLNEQPTIIKGNDIIDQAIGQLNEYYENERKQFTIPYKLYGTAFQKSVWNALTEQIPYGETKTYLQVGEIIHNKKAVRAVGGALNKNPCSIIVPCHRVIGSNGKLVGYGGGLDKKTYLLHKEQQH